MSAGNTIHGARINHLLLIASETLADGRIPFSMTWLQENEVSLQECITLSQTIATILKGYLTAAAGISNAIYIAGLWEGEPEVAEGISKSIALNAMSSAALERLKKHGN